MLDAVEVVVHRFADERFELWLDGEPGRRARP
jgi:hypothetical protein